MSITMLVYQRVYHLNISYHIGIYIYINTGRWFGTFFIFPYIGKNHPNWLIFSEGWNHQPISVYIYIFDNLCYIPIYRAMFSQDHLTCFLPGTLALDVFHHAMERYGPRCLANQTWLAGQSPRINGYTWSFEWKNPKLTWNPQRFNSTTHLDEWKMTSQTLTLPTRTALELAWVRVTDPMISQVLLVMNS